MGEFVLKTRIFMGKDGLDEILQGVSRAFIVTDRFMHESGKVWLSDRTAGSTEY